MVTGGPKYLILIEISRNAMMHQLLKPLSLFANFSNGLEFSPVTPHGAGNSHTHLALK